MEPRHYKEKEAHSPDEVHSPNTDTCRVDGPDWQELMRLRRDEAHLAQMARSFAEEKRHIVAVQELFERRTHELLLQLAESERARQLALEEQGRLRREIERLGSFILETVPGELGENEGAIDTAIRLIKPPMVDKKPSKVRRRR